MLIRGLGALIACAALAGAVSAASQFVTGPLPSHTGADATGGLSAEANCTVCHERYDGMGGSLPNLNVPGGGITITGLPATWMAGETYPIGIMLSSDSTSMFADRRWGFQITAIFAADGEGAGVFQTTNPDSIQVISGHPAGSFASRSYAEHTFDGTQAGAVGPVFWEVDWVAPGAPGGTVLFYAAGNAADGMLDAEGDFIYTTSDSVVDHTTPTHFTTWGAVKQRWR